MTPDSFACKPKPGINHSSKTWTVSERTSIRSYSQTRSNFPSTLKDAAGTKPDWSPLEARVPLASAASDTGSPVTATIVSAQRDVGGSEVGPSVGATSPDVMSSIIEVDQDSGFLAGNILLIQSMVPAATI